MKRLLIGIAAIVMALMLASPAHADYPTMPSGVQGPFAVTKVVDGDTIWIDHDGHREKIRLIGMDTPETVDPRKPVLI
jgi:micrococcal nuclease